MSDYSAYELAHMADCVSPDTLESPGAELSDMDQCASVCLYMIAERLAMLLIEDGESNDA